MTEAQLAAVGDPGGAVRTGDTLPSLPTCRGRGALTGALRAVDGGPLAPAPLGALVPSNTVGRRLARPASLHPAGEERQEMLSDRNLQLAHRSRNTLLFYSPTPYMTVKIGEIVLMSPLMRI